MIPPLLEQDIKLIVSQRFVIIEQVELIFQEKHV
jgi:hypothetical protein